MIGAWISKTLLGVLLPVLKRMAADVRQIASTAMATAFSLPNDLRLYGGWVGFTAVCLRDLTVIRIYNHEDCVESCGPFDGSGPVAPGPNAAFVRLIGSERRQRWVECGLILMLVGPIWMLLQPFFPKPFAAAATVALTAGAANAIYWLALLTAPEALLRLRLRDRRGTRRAERLLAGRPLLAPFGDRSLRRGRLRLKAG